MLFAVVKTLGASVGFLLDNILTWEVELSTPAGFSGGTLVG